METFIKYPASSNVVSEKDKKTDNTHKLWEESMLKLIATIESLEIMLEMIEDQNAQTALLQS